MKYLILSALILAAALVSAPADTVGEPPVLNPTTVAGVDADGKVQRLHLVGTALKVTSSDTAEQLTPTLTIASSNGTIASGARYVSIALSDDFAGTIMGTAVTPADVSSITFAAPTGSTLTAISYTRSAGKLIILTLRP